jgi:hypothetical protein
LDDSYGDRTTGLGWWSNQLESREPTWWIGASIKAKLPILVATLISTTETSSPTELSVTQVDTGFNVKWFNKDNQQSCSFFI